MKMKVLFVVASIWPVWHWYFLRLTDRSDYAWGFITFVLCLLFMMSHRSKKIVAPKTPGMEFYLYTICYWLTWIFHLPSLLKAVFGMLMLYSGLIGMGVLRRRRLNIICLIILSLPWMASLYFFLSYPMRILAGKFAVYMLYMNGYQVGLEGINLVWQGKTLVIDAPCSGVNMLWIGLVFNCILSEFRNLSNKKFVFLQMLIFPLVIFFNGLRTTALFHYEYSTVSLPSWMHQGIGVICFVGLCLSVVALSRLLLEEKSCAM